MRLPTADEIREAVLAAGTRWIPHHRCSFCNAEVGHFVEAGDLWFDSSCGCASSPARPCSWDEAAESFEMNKANPEALMRLRQKWHLDPAARAQAAGGAS